MSEIVKAIYLRKGLQSFYTWPPPTKTNLFFFETFYCMTCALYNTKRKICVCFCEMNWKTKIIITGREILNLPIFDNRYQSKYNDYNLTFYNISCILTIPVLRWTHFLTDNVISWSNSHQFCFIKNTILVDNLSVIFCYFLQGHHLQG